MTRTTALAIAGVLALSACSDSGRLMNPDGTDVLGLTSHAAMDTAPEWSPDGRRTAFHRDVEYLGEVHGELLTMNVDGSDQRMLGVPSFKGFHGFPSWSQGHDAVP